MAGIGIVRNIIVVAMGAGALGGPDALRLILSNAGRSPLADISIAVFVTAALTAPALGTMLLARFFRKAGGGPGHAMGAAAEVADPFATMTLIVSLAVAFLVSASLILLPVPVFQSGDLAPLAFAVAALAVGARVRGVRLPIACGGAGPALAVPLAVVVHCVAVGMFDATAQRFRDRAVALKNTLATGPFGVPAAIVVTTTLVALFFCKAQHAAASTATARFHKMILVVITTLLVIAFFLKKHSSE
uniref:Uncharacterized protein n=1 Tax=Leersia perrieri TaxID=77586 RepID=A0A0D9WN02_9ORYZ